MPAVAPRWSNHELFYHRSLAARAARLQAQSDSPSDERRLRSALDQACKTAGKRSPTTACHFSASRTAEPRLTSRRQQGKVLAAIHVAQIAQMDPRKSMHATQLLLTGARDVLARSRASHFSPSRLSTFSAARTRGRKTSSMAFMTPSWNASIPFSRALRRRHRLSP